MDDLTGARASPIFRHHWLAYWRELAGIASLWVLGSGGILVWPLLGFGLWALAMIGALAVYLCREWQIVYFTADHRLVRCRSAFRCTRDVITLFGVITPHQIPVLGPWLDMGNVHLGIPGPDVHISCLAHFREFFAWLVNGANRQQLQAGPRPAPFPGQWPPIP